MPRQYLLMHTMTGALEPVASCEAAEQGEWDDHDRIIVELEDGVYRVRDFDGEVLVETDVEDQLLGLWERVYL